MELKTYIIFCFVRYQVSRLSKEDRSRFFDALFEAAVSLQKEESRSKVKDTRSLKELPKVPKEAIGPKPSELKARAEGEQHAVRRLRMCLRDVCNRYKIIPIFCGVIVRNST
jgi:ATPase family AAA domain-containing protein 2